MVDVCVLMSTYNGEKYIEEQINSIIKQRDVNVTIIIRDDGSTDKTVSIIENEMKLHSNIHLIEGENIGASMSFFSVLWDAPLNYDYYAFSDQDDYWLENKLIKAVNLLEKTDAQIKVYSSSLCVVDRNLNIIADTPMKRVQPTFGNSLIENVLSGCTAVMSKDFVQLVRTYEMPRKQLMHDWWAYKVATAYGVVIHDYNSYILYRQHDNNTIGLSSGLKSRVYTTIKNAVKISKYVSAQNAEFEEIYDVPKENAKILYECNHTRLKRLINNKIVRQNKIETIVYKLWMLLW